MKPIYVQIIQQYLDKKKEQNPNYSLRALAARLEIAPSVLSEVLSQKRRLPVKKIDSVIEKLNLTEQEEKAFRYSIKKASTNLRQLAKIKKPYEKKPLDQPLDFKIIAEWEYYAVFSYFDIKPSISDAQEIGEALNLSMERVNEVLGHLIERGYLSKSDGVYSKSCKYLQAKGHEIAKAIRQAHKSTLNMAIEKVDTVELDKRYFFSTTLAIDPQRIEEARILYREFQSKLSSLLENEKPSEVYRFAFQLFPLSNSKVSG